MDSSATSPSFSSVVAVASSNNSNGSSGGGINNSSSSRESALSPSAAPLASPPVTSQDDAAISVAAGLAKEAALLFQSGKFVECMNVLNKLLQKKENDPKILHNIAIAEYFQDGCTDPKKLIEVLNDVKKRSEGLARASEEQTEAVSNTGGRISVGSKGSVAQCSSTSRSPVVYIDEFDTSVTMFNMAVIWFHLHEYAKSFSILDSLYQNIEPIDEGTALRISLLLLDVGLLSNHASRSADVITYVEKVFCMNSFTNQVDNGSSTQHQLTALSKSASLPSSASIPDSDSDSAPNTNALESSLSRTFSEEGLEDESLQLLSSLDISRENPRRPSNIESSNDFIRIQTEDSMSTIDLRLKLHLYKVWFLLLTRNLKAAKREVKMAMNVARGKDYTLALYLKSQLEYARGNHRKAIKLLMASSNRTEMEISSIYHNNLGCIYYRLGKFHTSSVFFSRALSNSSSLRKERPLKLATPSQDKSLHIVYNCGLLNLACGKPLQAAHCFQKASVIFFNKPLLWLRIAECCVMALEKGLLNPDSLVADGSDIKVHVIGKGKWRQLALQDRVSKNGQMAFDEREKISSEDDKQTNLSVRFARQCLLDALHLLDISDAKYSRYPKSGLVTSPTSGGNESGDAVAAKGTHYKNVAGSDTKTPNAAVDSAVANSNGEVKEQKGGNSQNASLQSSLSDYEEISRKENQMIREATLADLAYVELELGNPLKALSTARSLLRLPESSRIYTFLGNVYAAEALCLLNRPKEAAEHLFVYVAGDKNVGIPYSQDDFEKWRVEKLVDFEDGNGSSVPDDSQGFVFLKPEEARGTLYVNLAALSASQGDLDQAKQFVSQALSIMPNSREAILTSIYLDLMQGKPDDALSKLKQCNCVRYVPGNLTLNGSN